MKTQFHFKQNNYTSLLMAVLPVAMLLNPAAGIAQTHFSAAGSSQAFDTGKSELTNIVTQLESNALLFLLGAAVLMGIAWFAYVFRTCADLNKNTPKMKGNVLFLLGMLALPGITGSGCSSTQLARAAEMRAAQATESSNCICQSAAPNNLYYGMSGMYNLTPYYTNSNAFNRPVCKRCGRPVANRSH